MDRLRAETRRAQATVRPELEGELEDRGDAFLGRDLDVIAAPGLDAPEERAERRDRRVDPGLEPGLVAEGFQRRTIRLALLAVQGRHAARAPGYQIRAAVGRVRAGHAKGRDRGHDELRAGRREARIVEPLGRGLAW